MKDNINITGQIIATLSFVIGTCLLSFYLYFGETAINPGFAFGFVVIAFVLNLVLFTVVLGSAIISKRTRKEALITCGIMLLNIPIAVLYVYMVITFSDIRI